VSFLEISEGHIFLRHFAAWEESARRHVELNIAAHGLFILHEEHVHDQLKLVHALIRQILIVILLQLVLQFILECVGQRPPIRALKLNLFVADS